MRPPASRGRAAGAATIVALAAGAALTPAAHAAPDDLPEPLAAYPLTVDASDSVGDADGTPVGAVTFGAEGVALPGNSASTTNYVSLPGDTFEGHDALTISLWVKATTGSGNYSAMFVGTPAQANNLPERYWLLNPRNPSGNFKTVVTNGSSPSSPWSTEVGPAGPSTVGYAGVWTHYATVISDTSIEGFINGESIGSAPRTDDLSSFGTNLQAYLGRSNYTADRTWAGNILDLRVYGDALDDADVADVFADAQDAPTKSIVLAQAAASIDLGDTSNVSTDLVLPTTGAHGATVAWESLNPAVVSSTGEVTLPAERTTVTLRATVTVPGGASTTRDFTVVVPARPADAAAAADAIALTYVLAGDDALPTSVLGATVAWSSSVPGLIDGATVVGTETGLEEATLTATVTLEGDTAERSFEVLIGEADSAFATGYTRTPVHTLNSAMHLAVSTDGEDYEALNHNQGVLFAAADFAADALNGVTKQLVDPYLFRMEDGSFGVVATRTNANEAVDPTAAESVLLFTSEDLISYDEVGLVDVADDTVVSDPSAEFDPATGEYLIGFRDSEGARQVVSTADFATVSEPEPGVVPERVAPELDIAGAQARNGIVLTQAEADTLHRRFDYVTNTTVDAPETVSVPAGAEVPSLGAVNAHYSDGSQAAVPVSWSEEDLAAIDTAVPGTYEVAGEVKAVEHDFPLVPELAADPDIIYRDGYYYLIATNEAGIAPPGGSGRGQGGLYVRKASTVEGLRTAERQWILTDTTNLAWAPEIHEIDGELYLNWARGGVWNQVKSTVVKLRSGGDPAVAADWDFANATTVVRANGSAIQPNGITLDMTYFEVDHQWYAMWSDRVISPVMGSADLKIATIDPADPGRLTSEPVTLARPTYGWDRNETNVVEGPYALFHDGKVVITLSGAQVNQTYAVGQMEASLDADLLDPESWTRSNAPLLNSANVAGQAGPGHNAYFTDADGQLLTAIHARTSAGRQSGVRVAHWGEFGNVVLDMIGERHVLPENRAVTATVLVEAPSLTLRDIATNPFKAEIEWLAATGVTTGWATSTPGVADFRPLSNVNRDQMAAFLYRLAGEPSFDAPATPTFLDVPTDYVFYKEIEWLATTGVTTGWDVTGGAEFRPRIAVNRDVMAAFLHRYAGSPDFDAPAVSPFVDVKTNHVFYKEIAWLNSTGISQGWTVDGDKQFRTTTPVKRDVMAAFLSRYADQFLED